MVIRETERSRAKGAEFVALNPRGLAVRERDDFVSFFSEGKTSAVAAAAHLRFMMVTPKAPVLLPFPSQDTGRQHMRFEAARWAGRLWNEAILGRPFIFIGLPGIELSASGTALLLYATIGRGAESPSIVPLSVVGALALLFGVFLMITCAVIIAVLYSMGADGHGRPPIPRTLGESQEMS
jgi:hypothetical protein